MAGQTAITRRAGYCRKCWSIAAAVVLGCVLAQQLNWFAEPRDWRSAAGIERIPESELPRPYRPSAGEPEVFWLGHAGFLLRWNGATIVFDPNLSSSCTISNRVAPPPVKLEELPPVDAVLLSHAHYDHMDMPTLEGIAELRLIVLPAGSQDFLLPVLAQRSEIVGLAVGQSIELNGLKITAVPARHNGSRNHPFTSTYFALGYILQTEGHTLYFSGDTGWGPHFAEIAEKYRPELAILPIGGYRPYFILGSYHLSPNDAVAAAKVLGVKAVFPAHFGTFRVAFDYPDTPLALFAARAAKEQVLWHLAPMFNAHTGFSSPQEIS